MKWLIPFTLISLQAFACPDLTGIYNTCTRISGDGNSEFDHGYNILLKEAGGIAYVINNETIIANGVNQTLPPSQTGNDTPLNVSFHCTETQFIGTMSDEYGSFTINTAFEKRGENLLIKMSADVPGINDVFLCK